MTVASRRDSKWYPIVMILLSPFFVLAAMAAVLGLTLALHYTVAKGVQPAELFFVLLFALSCCTFGVYRVRRPPRGPLTTWEVDEKLGRRH